MRANLLPLFAAALLLACAKLPPKPILSRHQIADDRRPIDAPKAGENLKYGELLEVNSFYHIEKLSDPRTYGRLAGKVVWGYSGPESSNINLFDDAPDSTWFTNRNARSLLSIEETERGPTTVRLASEGPLRVVSGKSAGVTPGFVVKDPTGQRFMLKFDPPGGCGLPSSAEVISSRILHAAGYNVPENNIEYIDPARFILDPKATTRGQYGKKAPLTEETFRKLLDSIAPCGKEGKTRAMASRYIAGAPVGPFSYRGRRGDDPNDRVSHENRRELRGLSVLAAWLNHTDFTSYNTFDAFVKTDGEKGHIVHYLIDFGGTLGAEAQGPKGIGAGNEYDFDYTDMGLNLLSLGVREPRWKTPIPIRHPSIGNFNLTDFDPARWVPSYPNPAMFSRTPRDAWWGARAVASFSDAQLAAVVKAADLPDPGAPEEMIRLLAHRRDMIADYWFGRVGSLDRFEIAADSSRVEFFDWQRAGVWASHTPPLYRWDLKGKSPERSGTTKEPKIQIFETPEAWQTWKDNALAKNKRYLRLKITPVRELRKKDLVAGEISKTEPVSPATEALLYLDDSGSLKWAGTRRAVKM